MLNVDILIGTLQLNRKAIALLSMETLTIFQSTVVLDILILVQPLIPCYRVYKTPQDRVETVEKDPFLNRKLP